MKPTWMKTGVFLGFGLLVTASWAAGEGGHSHGAAPAQEAAAGHAHVFDFGEPGTVGAASRSIEITLLDDMSFQPEKIEVQTGETIRFIVHNNGQLVHEFSLGNAAMHQEHQLEMQKMMTDGMLTPTSIDATKMEHGGVKHDDPNSALVEPGKSAELLWTFSKQGTIEFACNVPGHYQAGMVGKLVVE